MRPDSETVLGLRYELRGLFLCSRHHRCGLSVFDVSRAGCDRRLLARRKNVNVAIQSMRPYELRFGIGGEYPVWVFAPFLDLIGYAYWTNLGVAVDDAKPNTKQKAFGFSARRCSGFTPSPWFFRKSLPTLVCMVRCAGMPSYRSDFLSRQSAGSATRLALCSHLSALCSHSFRTPFALRTDDPAQP